MQTGSDNAHFVSEVPVAEMERDEINRVAYSHRACSTAAAN